MSFNHLIKEIATILKKKNWQLVTAESCTGGLIASSLTELPGSSLWFERGFVTYSNLSKEELLGVPKQLIEEYGAVSEPVALAMAKGALQHSKGHIAVAVTGIAGPQGGSLDKPVGTVYLAWAVLDTTLYAHKNHYLGTRKDIRRATCHDALLGIRSILGQS